MEVIGNLTQIYFPGVTGQTSGWGWIEMWLEERERQENRNKEYRQLFEAIWLRRAWKCQGSHKIGIRSPEKPFYLNKEKFCRCVKFIMKILLGVAWLKIHRGEEG